MWTRLGLPYSSIIPRHGVHTVTAQATTGFVKELSAGGSDRDRRGGRAGSAARACSFHLRMLHADTDEIHATYDLVEVFFDPETRKSAPMPDSVRKRLEDWLVAGEVEPDA